MKCCVCGFIHDRETDHVRGMPDSYWACAIAEWVQVIPTMALMAQADAAEDAVIMAAYWLRRTSI